MHFMRPLAQEGSVGFADAIEVLPLEEDGVCDACFATFWQKCAADDRRGQAGIHLRIVLLRRRSPPRDVLTLGFTQHFSDAVIVSCALAHVVNTLDISDE
jgi:hypothetical protein